MLQSARLTLREIQPTDLDDIHALLSLPETDFYNALGIPESIEVSRGYMDRWIHHQKEDPRTIYAFLISEKESGKFIGLTGLTLGKPKYRKAEVWYKIHVDHWGNGYATEVCKRLIDFGFNEIGLHRLEAGCAIQNKASVRVMEKAGMTLEGINKQLLPHQGGWLDCYMYAIVADDEILHSG